LLLNDGDLVYCDGLDEFESELENALLALKNGFDPGENGGDLAEIGVLTDEYVALLESNDSLG
jgi:hypothetical protein